MVQVAAGGVLNLTEVWLVFREEKLPVNPAATGGVCQVR